MLRKYRISGSTLALILAVAGWATLAHGAEPALKVALQNVGGVDAPNTATITGVVLFTGTKPEAKPVADIEGNAFCHECHPNSVPVRDTFLFGKNGTRDTLQNVLVYV